MLCYLMQCYCINSSKESAVSVISGQEVEVENLVIDRTSEDNSEGRKPVGAWERIEGRKEGRKGGRKRDLWG